MTSPLLLNLIQVKNKQPDYPTYLTKIYPFYRKAVKHQDQAFIDFIKADVTNVTITQITKNGQDNEAIIDLDSITYMIDLIFPKFWNEGGAFTDLTLRDQEWPDASKLNAKLHDWDTTTTLADFPENAIYVHPNYDFSDDDGFLTILLDQADLNLYNYILHHNTALMLDIGIRNGVSYQESLFMSIRPVIAHLTNYDDPDRISFDFNFPNDDPNQLPRIQP